jgi:hypothetical protein
MREKDIFTFCSIKKTIKKILKKQRLEDFQNNKRLMETSNEMIPKEWR